MFARDGAVRAQAKGASSQRNIGGHRRARFVALRVELSGPTARGVPTSSLDRVAQGPGDFAGHAVAEPAVRPEEDGGEERRLRDLEERVDRQRAVDAPQARSRSEGPTSRARRRCRPLDRTLRIPLPSAVRCV